MTKGKRKLSSVKQKNVRHTKLSKQGKLRGRRNKKKDAKSRNPIPKQTVPQEEIQDESDHGEDLLQMIESEDLDFLKKAVSANSYTLYSNEELAASTAMHFWEVGHEIENEIALLKQVEKPIELIGWENIFIKKNRKNLLNFDTSVGIQGTLIDKFIHPLLEDQSELADDDDGKTDSNDHTGRNRKRKKNENEEDGIGLEEKYEDESAQVGTKRTKYLLPIKTKEGLIPRSSTVDVESLPEPEPVEVYKPPEPESDVDSDEELQVELRTLENELNPDHPMTTAELLMAREEALRKRKVLIGVLASGIVENPQVKTKNFKQLLDLMNEESPELRITVCKLVAVTLLEVFKDMIPSYQIKHQDNSDVKLKKDTLHLQGFEKALLSSYKFYLQRLEKLLSVLKKKRSFSPQQEQLALLALGCMCDLLVTHPYFNYSQNLVQLLVPYLNHHKPSVRERTAGCFTTLFKNDKKGEISLEVVRRINHLVKSRTHTVHTNVLQVLLSLRIKEVNLDKEKEDEMKQKKFMKHKQKLLMLSRKERRRSKKLEALERELLETRAEENKQTKQQYLTEITKLVFTIYFRVLKKAPSSKVLSITLEGLARFAHCINMEFYQDIVNVLNQLLEQELLGYREQLHCVQTVFTILSGQGDFLNIDPLRFYSHLYRNLFLVHAGVSHPDVVTVLRTLHLALLQRRKQISQQRVLAFVKRLSTLALQLAHNGSLGCLATVKTIMQMNRYVDIVLDPDTSVGQGIYLPELEDPEYCNASRSALWELTALERHYHPTVRKFARNILLGAPTSGEGYLPPELANMSSEDLFTKFDSSEMAFNPPVPAPKKSAARSKVRAHFHLVNDELANYIKTVSDSVT